MTTTTWRARCSDCGLERRRKTAPRLRAGVHCDGFCPDCVHPLEWQRWEVVGERGWKVGERVGGKIVWADWNGRLVSGEPGGIIHSRPEADAEVAFRRLGNPAEVVVQRVVRRTLRIRTTDP